MEIIKEVLLTRYYLQQAAIDGDEGILMEVRFEGGARNILILSCIPQQYGPDLRALTVTTQVTDNGVKWRDVKRHVYKAFIVDDAEDEFPRRSYGCIIRRLRRIPDTD